MAAARTTHPGQRIEVWAVDEHRPSARFAGCPSGGSLRDGLKPIRRRVWAPKGQRPIVLGHHRYAWMHVTAFVQPARGAVVWYLSTGLSKPFFAALLAASARQVGAGRKRHIILVLDNAGWHGPADLAVPDGISLVFLPPYSPELQPAERLWTLVDEPIVNRHVENLTELNAIIARRCRRLEPTIIKPYTNFAW